MSAAVAAMGLLAATGVLVLVMQMFLTSTVMLASGLFAQGQNAGNANKMAFGPAGRDGINYSALLDPNGPDVQFILFKNRKRPFNLIVGDYVGFEQSGFDITVPTKIITHGYLSGIREEVFYKAKNAYLDTDEYNIVGMDWSVLCEFEYFSAMKGAQMAGDALSNFLNFLIRAGVKYDDIHVIGHSLGAHVAGMGGDGVKNGRIARITGLDPAGPGYSDVPHNLRLDPGDAKLVDVIHTYMRILSLAEPLGHVDFYPNGGRYQPGCPELLDIWKMPESIKCNHGRAYMYFVESIYNNQSFKAQKCDSVEDAIQSRCFQESDVYMGQEDTYQTGLYYVKTNVQYPFSLT